jgi:hypothetical protein
VLISLQCFCALCSSVRRFLVKHLKFQLSSEIPFYEYEKLWSVLRLCTMWYILSWKEAKLKLFRTGSSRSGSYEESYLLECNIVIWNSTNVMSPPTSDSKNKPSKKPAVLLAAFFMLVSGSVCFFRPWICRRHVSPKRQLTFNGLHGIISRRQDSSKLKLL